MAEWLQSGLRGRGLKNVLRLYVYSLMILAPFATLVVCMLEGDYRPLPVIVATLVCIQLLVGYLPDSLKKSDTTTKQNVKPFYSTDVNKRQGLSLVTVSFVLVTLSICSFMGGITSWVSFNRAPSMAPPNVWETERSRSELERGGNHVIILDQNIPASAVSTFFSERSSELKYELPTKLLVLTSGGNQSVRKLAEGDFSDKASLIRRLEAGDRHGVEVRWRALVEKGLYTAKETYLEAPKVKANNKSLYTTILAGTTFLRVNQAPRNRLYVLTSLEGEYVKSSEKYPAIDNDGIDVMFFIAPTQQKTVNRKTEEIALETILRWFAQPSRVDLSRLW